MARRVILIGGGGHALVALDILLATQSLEVVGFTSLTRNQRLESLAGVAYLGSDDVLPHFRAQGIEDAFVAIGDNRLRQACFARGQALGFTLINAISTHAIASGRASIGRGVALMPGAVVNAGTSIGDGSIINTNASVDHDCVIGEFAHVAPGCALAGHVTIGPRAMLGVGTRVIPGISIGPDAVVGAGAVVTKDVPSGCIAVGAPAAVKRRVQDAL